MSEIFFFLLSCLYFLINTELKGISRGKCVNQASDKSNYYMFARNEVRDNCACVGFVWDLNLAVGGWGGGFGG